MSRTYDDPSYGSKKQLNLLNTAAMNGTAAAATDQVHTFMQPVTVTDANILITTAGAGTKRSIIIGKSLAGTGAVTTIATTDVGTATVDTVVDMTATETDFATGDDLVVQIAGTGATVAVVCPSIQYRERYVQDDN